MIKFPLFLLILNKSVHIEKIQTSHSIQSKFGQTLLVGSLEC